jgi:LacI family gluconate utilization system Gnt-I transcriptional repressor
MGDLPYPNNHAKAGSRKGNRLTMNDVAALAKVSPSTVSLFLRNPSAVSAKRAERIQATINETGYTINRLAGALAGAHNRAVGVIVPSLINAFFSETLQAMQEIFEARGYQLLISNSDYDTKREIELLRTHLSWSPAALVLTGYPHPDARPMLAEAGIPIAQMWELGGQPFHLQVGFFHEKVGAALAEHVYAQGYRAFTYIGSRMHVDLRAKKRADGFCAWLTQKGYEIDVIALEDQTTTITMANLFEQIHLNDNVPRVLCFSNDILAISALFEAHRLGISVPNSLGIAGFGDLPLSQFSFPSLTTVKPYPKDIGRIVATRLITWIETGTLPTEPETIDLGFELIVRESTALNLTSQAPST